MEGDGLDFEVMTQHFCGDTKKNYENNLGWTVLRPRFKARIFQYEVLHSAAMFCCKIVILFVKDINSQIETRFFRIGIRESVKVTTQLETTLL